MIGLFFASGVAHADDDLSAYRERFRLGMDRYQAGAFGDAVQIWEPIYRELGPARGYRLAYNLGIAYEQLGDPTRAAERFASFLDGVRARKEAAEPLEARVLKQADDAENAIQKLNATYGRLVVAPRDTAPIAVRVDADEPRIAGFTRYVLPGSHRVTFLHDREHQEERTISVRAGEQLDIAPPEVPSSRNERTNSSAERNAPLVLAAPAPARAISKTTTHPIPVEVLYGGAALTVVSIAIPIITYSHAYDIRDEYDGTSDAGRRNQLQSDYESARSAAYATLAVPIGLGVATSVLAAWYVVGTKERATTPAAWIIPTERGVAAGIGARF